MFASPLRGIHVFWMVFVFFAVVFGVDTFFIARAVGTFPGEQVKNSYVLGLDYNREVQSRARQARLGWTARAGLTRKQDLSLVLRIEDRGSAPVSGLYVTAEYHVPGEGGDEQIVVMREVAPGEYEAPIGRSSARRIDVLFFARRTASDAPEFEARKSLVIS